MIYILIPTFNEALNISNLRQKLDTYTDKDKIHFVFADDCSTDETILLIRENFIGCNLTILEADINMGPGFAFNRGFNWILENSVSLEDVVVTMEADTTSDIDLLDTMLMLQARGFDMVLASVYAQGGGFSNSSFFRRTISFFANLFMRLFFDIKVLTLSSFYRTYSVKKLVEVKSRYKELISENGFVCMVELLVKFVKMEAKIIEVPMTLKSDNRKGESKMKIRKTFMQYMRFLFKQRSIA